MSRPPTTCPKCGFASTNDQACEACGVIFQKLRERSVAEDFASQVEEVPGAPFRYSAAGSFFSSPSKLVGALVFVVVLVMTASTIMRPKASKYTTMLTDANFESEVLRSSGVYVVDFWASWCPPCKKFSPIVEEFARDNMGKVRVGKMEADKNPRTSMTYGIRAIPAVLVFKDGKLTGPVPAMDKEGLEKLILPMVGQ